MEYPCLVRYDVAMVEPFADKKIKTIRAFGVVASKQLDNEETLLHTLHVPYMSKHCPACIALQELYLGSVLMMDPMSLLDYPEVDGTGDVLIVVEGEMDEETKK